MSKLRASIDDAASLDPAFADLVHEVSQRLEQNALADVEDLLRQHPDYAERLRELLPALRHGANRG